METPPHTVKASEFKAKCLQLMDDVARTGQPLTITKHGKPVVQIAPITQESPMVSGTLFGAMKGSITILGDIMSPLEEEWDVEKGEWEPRR